MTLWFARTSAYSVGRDACPAADAPVGTLSTASILLSTDRSSNTDTERCKSSTLTTMRHSSFCSRMTPSTPLSGPCAIRTRWPARRNGQGRTGKVELTRVRIVSISSSASGEGA